MINLCNTVRILKMAACLYHGSTKGGSCIIVWGKLRHGKQMRRCYLPTALLDNEDKS